MRRVSKVASEMPNRFSSSRPSCSRSNFLLLHLFVSSQMSLLTYTTRSRLGGIERMETRPIT